MLPTLPTRERLTLGYFHCNNKLIKNKNKYKYKNPSQPPPTKELNRFYKKENLKC